MEKGVIEAHFDLALMTGCPVHSGSAGQEEQPGVHSRGAEARAAPLAIVEKAEVAIAITSFAVNYGWYVEVKFSSTAWRARIALSSSSPSFSA